MLFGEEGEQQKMVITSMSQLDRLLKLEEKIASKHKHKQKRIKEVKKKEEKIKRRWRDKRNE